MVIVVAAFNLCKFLTEIGGEGGVTGGLSLPAQSRRRGGGIWLQSACVRARRPRPPPDASCPVFQRTRPTAAGACGVKRTTPEAAYVSLIERKRM